MSLRAALSRAPLRQFAARRLSTAAEAPSKGPKLPIGNDPSAYHGAEHAIADTNRWRLISMVFAVPVTGYFVLSLMSEHKHVDPPPEYPYLRMATRSPRFPWGDDDLIGTSYERHAKKHAEEGH